MRFVDDQDFGFGWVADDETVRRTSHALVVDGGVWFVDPVDWPEAEERARLLGEPRGVIQLLDRHNRDCAALAVRLGVPHHALPARIEHAEFEFLPIARNRWWREVALWWPARRVLVCADAVGTLAYFRARRAARPPPAAPPAAAARAAPRLSRARALRTRVGLA
jgi:hypothetical protein